MSDNPTMSTIPFKNGALTQTSQTISMAGAPLPCTITQQEAIL